MQAIVLHRHGGPEELQAEIRPAARPATGHAAVRIRACALNHLDLFLRQGIPGIEIGLPRILGSDMAGEIAELGPDPPSCTSWKVGDAVVLAPGVGCGVCHACLDGRDNECPTYTLFGYKRDGGYAQSVIAPLRNLLPKPPRLNWTEAAAAPLVFLTAWNMLVRRARVQAGQTVLVLAASSGVGMAAVQIARLLGCRVIATAGGPAKLELARRLGADHVVDHDAAPIARQVRAIAPAGVDVVIEHVGEATWEQSLRALAPGGTLVICGATTGFEGRIDLRFLFSRQLNLLGSYMGRRADLDRVLEFLASGELKPVVDRVFPLAETADAHRYLEAKQQFGKVVLEVPE